VKAGSQSPLLVTMDGDSFPNAWSVSALGALHALYVVRTNIVDILLQQFFSYGFSVPMIFLLKIIDVKVTIINHKRQVKSTSRLKNLSFLYHSTKL